MSETDSSKLCECGCGEPAPLSKITHRARGYVKGQPLRFVSGHNLQRPSDVDYIAQDCGHVTPCWIWQRGRYSTGYGYMTKKQAGCETPKLAHRVYYARAHGLHVDDAPNLDHLCGVKLCCNPSHLEPVTHAENIRRSKVAILSAEQVAEIRAMWPNRKYGDGPRLARKYGVSVSRIYTIGYGYGWGGHRP